MAITKYFNRTSNIDYQWLGIRLNNSQYSETHNEAVNTLNSTVPKIIRQYYAYLPANLNYSTTEYETFITDVNWLNGKPAEQQSSAAPLARDWNSVESTPVDSLKIDLAQNQWANVFNINNVNATISFAYASLHRSSSGVTYVGGDNTAVGGGNYQNQYVIFINYDLYNGTTDGNSVVTNNLSLGTWGGWTAMHELGHVWGLPHNVPEKSDDLRFSIMTYPNNFNTNIKIPLTPGMADIKAMQIKYGLSDAQDGDTNYVFTQSSIDLGHGNILANVQTNVNINRYVLTISDRQGSAGGIDTIDASALGTQVYIDLRAGHFSAIGTDINIAPTDNDINGDGDFDGDTRYNVGIAHGAEIENAKGGAVDDYIRGNDLANVLEGNGGNDTLQGGVGNDTLDGGSGFDTYKLEGLFTMATIKDNDGQGSITLDSHAIFGASKQILQDIYHDEGPGKKTYIKLSDGGLLVAGAGGEQNIYIQQWNSNDLGISLSGEVAAAPTGNVMNGDFKKAVGDGVLVSETGYLIANNNYVNAGVEINAKDMLYGDDNGSPTNDVIDGGGGDDFITGEAGNDYLMGGTGNDFIQGGLGSDTIMGGTGDDTLYAGTKLNQNKVLSTTYVRPASPFTNTQANGLNWVAGYNTLLDNGVPFGLIHTWNGTFTNNNTIESVANYIDGGAGDDAIQGDGGNDYLIGGIGKDWINAGFGNDIILGGADNDYIHGDLEASLAEDGNDIIDGGAGEDYLFGDGGADIIFGGSEDDHIWGDKGDTTASIFDGNDYLNGGAGNDQLVGGGGNDTLIGGAGTDSLFGGDGNDYLEGGTDGSNDVLSGEAGDDTIVGGEGADSLYGGAGSDTFYASDADILSGQDKDDKIVFLGGGNVTTVAVNANTTLGGAAITLNLGTAAINLLDGLVGKGDATYTFADGTQIKQSELIGTKLNSVVNIASTSNAIFGGMLADTLQATGTADSALFGGLGNDILIGNDGNNVLRGGNGNDTMRGGVGNDNFAGGVGDDTYYIELNTDPITEAANAGKDVVTEAANEGTDSVIIVGENSVTYTIGGDFILGANLENASLNLAITYNLIGNTSNNVLRGSIYANTIRGLEGNDTLIGLGGNDQLYGGEGDDFIDGGSDNDQLLGGNGNDTYLISGGGSSIEDDYIYDESGVNTIQFGAGITASNLSFLTVSGMNELLIYYPSQNSAFQQLLKLNLAGTATIGDLKFADGSSVAFQNLLDIKLPSLNLIGTVGNDTLNGSYNNDTIVGGDGDDYVTGNAGADFIQGENGNDRLYGNLGSDTLSGGIGNDGLNGGEGADVIEGGAGNDFLAGGIGDDVYIFNLGFGVDTIDDASSYEQGSFNAIQFGAGITGNNLALTHSNNGSLNISIIGSTDSINLNYIHFDPSAANTIEKITFSDGTIWNLEAIIAKSLSGSNGDDTLWGYDQNDTIEGGLGNDTLYGGWGDDVLLGGAGDDYLDGGDGNDFLKAGSCDTAYYQYLYGQSGDDTLEGGGSENDLLTGNRGNDTYLFGIGSGKDTILNTDRNWVPTPNSNVGSYGYDSGPLVSYIDTLQFGAGITAANLLIWRNAGSVWISIKDTKDLVKLDSFYSFNADGSLLILNDAIEVYKFANGTTWDINAIISQSITSNRYSNTLTLAAVLGSNADDVLSMNPGVVYGLAGNDTINGSFGDDYLDGGIGNDELIGSDGYDFYTFSAEHGYDRILNADSNPAATQDVILLQNIDFSTVQLSKVGGDLIITTGVTSNITVVDYALSQSNQIDSINFSNGTNWDSNYINTTVFGATNGNDFLTGTAGNDNMYGLSGNDTLNGGLGADRLYGGDGNDSMSGGDGDDTLYGGSGSDTLIGGLGNDTYEIDSLDTVTEAVSAGTDTIISTLSYTLKTNFENLVLTGIDYIDGIGNASNNVITGNVAGNFIDGGAGNDTMLGGLGDDSYIVNATGDVVTENFNEGNDYVESTVTFTLGNNLEYLTLTGASAINGTGNALANSINGNNAANLISGLDGDDYLDGGLGNDNLVGGAGSDVYYFVTGYGNDQIDNTATDNSTAIDVLNLLDILPANVVLTRTAYDLLIKISVTDSVTVKNYFAAGDSRIDQIIFGDSTVWNQADIESHIVINPPTTGDDSLTGTASNDVIDALAGNDTVFGGDGNDKLLGNTGNDSLDGGLGLDTLTGGTGNDIYVIDNTGDVISETSTLATEIDEVQSSISYQLGANLEKLTLTGTVNLDGTGNTIANTLTGNSANNILDGGAGIDTMIGGLGDDTYIIDVATDVITEAVNAGADTVRSAITYVLGATSNLENLTLTGTSAINGTGNTLANVITGNSAANTLDGSTGADTLIGGAGNDIYTVDNALDIVTENLNEGTDRVNSSIAFSIATFANVENLTLTGTSAINATGNTLDNVLTGNTGNNSITGGAGNDTIDGGTGNDTMVGGAGNDVYFVNVTTDVVTELANEGTDTINSAVTLSIATLTNIENITLTGSTAINATGNTLANILIGSTGNNSITGGAGNDTIDGGTGNDTMVGGAGNDVYFVNIATDVVTELANEGIDTVNSAVTYSLVSLANIENVTLTGSTAINATGNALANTLIGNSGNNILTGGTGADILTGGLGTDTFDFNAILDSLVGTSRDVITDFSRIQLDKIDLSTIDANSTLANDQAFLSSILTSGAFTSIGQLRLVGDILSGNTDSNFATSEFEIQLTGVTSLTSADFVL